MKKRLEDMTVRDLDNYCHNTKCEYCEFRKENNECYNLQDLFNEIDFYNKHELKIEIK